MTDTSFQGSGTNKMTLDFLFAEAERLGEQEGLGAAARPDYALIVAEAASQGLVSTDNKDAVKAVYHRYTAAVAKAKRRVQTGEQSSQAQQLSKWRTIINIGARAGHNGHNYNADKLLRDAMRIRDEHKDKIGGSTFDCMVKVANKQMDGSNKSKQFDDDAILFILARDAAKERDELARAKAIHQTMVKMWEGNENSDTPAYPSEELGKAMAWMNDLVERLTIEAEKARIVEYEARVAARVAGEPLPDAGALVTADEAREIARALAA